MSVELIAESKQKTKIESFEDILAWQKARELTNIVYEEFRGCRDFAFRDQICRASLSIMNNIAEGFERNSNKEFKHFLFISKGSCAEVRSMLIVAEDQGYTTGNNSTKMKSLANEIPRLLRGFIKVL